MSWLLPRDSLIEVIYGPLLWIIFFVVAYTAMGAGCEFGLDKRQIGGLDAVQAVILAAAAVTGILLLAGGSNAWLHLREARRAHHGPPPEPRKERRYFLALSSLCLIGLALVGTVWVTAAMLLVRVC